MACVAMHVITDESIFVHNFMVHKKTKKKQRYSPFDQPKTGLKNLLKINSSTY